MDNTKSERLDIKDNDLLQTEVPTSAYKTRWYIQAKIGYKVNQTRLLSLLQARYLLYKVCTQTEGHGHTSISSNTLFTLFSVTYGCYPYWRSLLRAVALPGDASAYKRSSYGRLPITGWPQVAADTYRSLAAPCRGP
ncbi:hypothetical protein GW17_00010038 [Ensete ventricosum]|nr:hypothetical protein GW17_00010038 [Ensete ventricosum]